MRDPFGKSTVRARPVHPYQWLWEPLENDPGFSLRAMFGAKAAYLDDRLVLCFCARHEPWQGLLVCTERTHHPALQSEFPALIPHPILPKWLYLPEAAAGFEATAPRLVQLARRRDPRMGIMPPPRKRRTRSRPRGKKPGTRRP